MRGARVLLQKAAEAGKPKPMSADQSLYHVMPTGFWKKFRDAVVVNPEISTGLPYPDRNRYPPPGSRTERYSTPATAASDVAFNDYFQRDTRRSYPRTSVVTQAELSELLLNSPQLKSVAAPAEGETAVVATEAQPLTDVLAKLPEGTAVVALGIETGSSTGLPPTPPGYHAGGKKWKPVIGDEVPHFEHQYFNMYGYK